MRTMRGALGLLMVSVLLAACGTDGGADAASAEDVEAALERADAAVERIDALEEEVAALEDELLDSEGTRKDAMEKIGKIEDRLSTSISNLRKALGKAKGSSSTALARAEEAASAAAVAARDLAVLEDRFNFHLQREHGGG